MSKITVAEITRNCSLSSPTFYRHFKDKYDLMVWMYIREAQKSLAKIDHDRYLWKDTLLDGLRYFAKNREYMVNALKHTSGRDSFVAQMAAMNVEIILDEVRKGSGTSVVPDDLAMEVKIYCYGTEQYLCEWLMDGCPASCEEVAAAMGACIPERLRPYLCE